MFKNSRFDFRAHLLTLSKHKAFISPDCTFQNLLLETTFYYEWFMGNGINENDEVVFEMPNDYRIVAALLALWKIGASPVLITPGTPHKYINPITSLPSGKSDSEIDLTIELSQVAFTLFTSGTTANAKGVVLTVGNVLNSAKDSAEYFKLALGDVWMIGLPMSRIAGIMIPFRTIISGSSSTFSGSATHYSLIPKQLLQNPSRYSDAKALLVGGGPIPQKVKDLEKDHPLYYSYGMTEMCSTIAIAHKNKTTILPSVDLKIIDKVIHLKGATLFKSYLGEKDQKGYFATNDLGELVDGKLNILGRKDTVFISGGVNIDPAQIEEALKSLPNISKAKVVPKEDSEFGMVPIAYIDSEQFDTQEIKERLNPLLHPYYIPKEIYPIDEK